jgi:nitrogen regulatory protein P-II 1
MQILLIILYREDLLDEVLTALVEMEITGAAVLDGTSMERVLSEDVPIFAGLWDTLGSGGGQTRTIVAPIKDRSLFEPLIRLLREAGADFANPDIGKAFTIPVDLYVEPNAGENS